MNKLRLASAFRTGAIGAFSFWAVGCGGSGVGCDDPFLGLLFHDPTIGATILHRVSSNGGTALDVDGTASSFVGSLTQDGTVFTSFSAGNDDVFSVLGGVGTQLTASAGNDFRPVVNPDGTKVAFVSDRDGNNEVYSMNGDGSVETNVSNNAASDYFPSISMDGTRIVFESFRDGNEEVYIVNSNGTGLLRLTTNAAEDTTPSFSPNGTQVYFVSDRVGGIFQIFRMDDDGTNVVQITTTPGNKFHASCNIAGTKLFFYINGGGGTNGLYRCDLNGANQQIVTGTTANSSKTSSWVY